MESEALAEARQKAQDASSRARLATNPSSKRAWQELADKWLARLAEPERNQHRLS
jgi:hypothetical protein